MSKAFDVRFIDSMVPHHETAIAMAQLASERAAHAEIKRFAAEVIATQKSEITQMESWRRAWARTDPAAPKDAGASPPEATVGGTGMSGDMQKQLEGLRKADHFDEAFLKAMLPHHESAIEMAKSAVDRAEHVALRDLARHIVDAQTRDINRMEGWRRAWS